MIYRTRRIRMVGTFSIIVVLASEKGNSEASYLKGKVIIWNRFWSTICLAKEGK